MISNKKNISYYFIVILLVSFLVTFSILTSSEGTCYAEEDHGTVSTDENKSLEEKKEELSNKMDNLKIYLYKFEEVSYVVDLYNEFMLEIDNLDKEDLEKNIDFINLKLAELKPRENKVLLEKEYLLCKNGIDKVWGIIREVTLDYDIKEAEKTLYDYNATDEDIDYNIKNLKKMYGRYINMDKKNVALRVILSPIALLHIILYIILVILFWWIIFI